MIVESVDVQRARSKILDYADYHTSCFTQEETDSMFERFRSPRVANTYTCKYCGCINPAENVHCEHCGAPHTEPEQTEYQRLQDCGPGYVWNGKQCVPSDDSDQYKVDKIPCPRCLGQKKVKGLFGRMRTCPECDGEGEVTVGVMKVPG
jgi:hypothetical protein